jgi:hypothetical protein
MTYTDADFEHLSWHDCHLYAFDLRTGDAEQKDWTSDLVLDIDFIVEWICGVGGGAQFRVAPATLVFHGVTDLRIRLDWGDSGFRAALNPASIERIDRERVLEQKVFLDRAYYRWDVRLNWPPGGAITFGAVAFTQALRAEPVLSNSQHLPPARRARLP